MRTLSLSFKASLIAVVLGLILTGCPGTRPAGDAVGVAQQEQTAKQVVGEVLRRYEQKDLIGVMDRIATGYLGDRGSLERDLDDQLRAVDSIDYEWFISRVRPGDDDRVIDVEFRWDRRWRDVDTGNETTASGSSTFRLVLDRDQWFIKDIRGDNPFL